MNEEGGGSGLGLNGEGGSQGMTPPPYTLRPIRLSMRPARVDDAAMVLRWRNAPDAVRWSRTGAVDPSGHLAWWERTVRDAGQWMLIGEVDGVPVGMVRLAVGRWDAELSVAVDPDWRGRGAGWQLVDAAVGKAWDLGILVVTAVVHEENLASRRLLLSCGFRRRGRTQEGPWITMQAAVHSRS